MRRYVFDLDKGATVNVPVLMLFLVAVVGSFSTAMAAPAAWPPASPSEFMFSAGPLSLRLADSEPSGTHDIDAFAHTRGRYNVVGMELWWKDLAVSEDTWDWTRWPERFDMVMAGTEGFHLGAGFDAPDWFLAGPNYVGLTDINTGYESPNALSIWAPGTLEAVRNYYSHLRSWLEANGYLGRVDILDGGLPISQYGEYLLQVSPDNYANAESAWWCGDPYALPDFQQWAVDKYANIAGVNAAWGTGYAAQGDIAFPDQATRLSHIRHWIDFNKWYKQSLADYLVRHISVVREYFPDPIIVVAQGGLDQPPHTAMDRTLLVKTIAGLDRVVPSLGGAILETQLPEGPNINWGYYMSKRTAAVARKNNLPFLSYTDAVFTQANLARRVFDDAAMGVRVWADWWGIYDDPDPSPVPGYWTMPDFMARSRATSQVPSQPLVDVGMLYSIAYCEVTLDVAMQHQMFLEYAGHDYFDYDVVDDNMIEWGYLPDYKVLINTDADIYEQSALLKLDDWIKKGGLLITQTLALKSVEGNTAISDAWAAASTQASSHGVIYYLVGNGAIAVAAPPDGPTWDASETVKAIADIHEVRPGFGAISGYDGIGDGVFHVDFPKGQLAYNTQTLETRFAPASECYYETLLNEEWQALVNAKALDGEISNVPGAVIPERWSLALVMDGLCNAKNPHHIRTLEAYNANLAALAALPLGTYATIQPYEHVLAALFLIDQLRQDYYLALFGLSGTFTVYGTAGKNINEPYSDGGDLDGDGLTNLIEYNNVAEWGTWDSFVDAATMNWQTGAPLPTDSKAGLLLLVLAMVSVALLGLRKSMVRRTQS